jgi:hypothetical protein
MNTTNINNYSIFLYDDFTNKLAIIQGSIYIPIFCAGIANNFLTILIISLNRDMRTVTNCYLLNLAISDTLPLIVSLPFEISVRIFLFYLDKFEIYFNSSYQLKFHGDILVVNFVLFLLKLLQIHRY